MWFHRWHHFLKDWLVWNVVAVIAAGRLLEPQRHGYGDVHRRPFPRPGSTL